MRQSVSSSSRKSVHPFKSAAEFEAALAPLMKLPPPWRKRSIDFLLKTQSKKLRDRMVVFGVLVATDHEMLLAREDQYEDEAARSGRIFADYVRNGLRAYEGSSDPLMRELRFLYGAEPMPEQ
jgi:hypothetical protein